mmetsp:Transcript_782/g.1672  ORF Transcript_782/g.1672 Transcript_782/m.1672 type:complete len:519 (+) Transcript_782:50-1606(+)
MARHPDEGHKLFVGRLPPDCQESELRTVFSTYGEVTNVILLKPHERTGHRSAFVFYREKSSGEDAIKLLNDSYKIRTDAENTLAVRWARRDGQAPAGPAGDDAEAAHSADGFKLFVGGLPADVTTDELQIVFQTYGEVSMVHPMPPSNQSGNAAAFVFYKTKEGAEDAIKLLDGKYKIREDAEHSISVRWGKDKRAMASGKGGKGDSGFDSGKAGGGGGSWDSHSGGGGWSNDNSSGGDPKVFVGGLPPDITQDEVLQVFSTYGEVQKIHLFEPHSVNKLVAGFVFYKSAEAADDAIKLLDGQYKIREDAAAPITVKWAKKDTKGGGGGGSDWDGKSHPYGGKGGGGGKAPHWQDDRWGHSNGDWHGQAYGGGAPGGEGWGGGNWHGGGGYGGAPWGGGAEDASWGGKNGHYQGKGQAGGGGKGSEKGDKNRLFVGNLPQDITEDALTYVFGMYGKVDNIYIMAGKSKSGQSCAFINYTDASEAETAVLTLHDKYEIRPGQGPIVVKVANARDRQRPY